MLKRIVNKPSKSIKSRLVQKVPRMSNISHFNSSLVGFFRFQKAADGMTNYSSELYFAVLFIHENPGKTTIDETVTALEKRGSEISILKDDLERDLWTNCWNGTREVVCVFGPGPDDGHDDELKKYRVLYNIKIMREKLMSIQ